MFFEDIRSERLLMQHAADRLSVRWYLGYDLDEELPDHSSLTRIRTRYGIEIFRRFFETIVEQCQKSGLVWGREVYADATKAEANAALDSLQPRFAVEEHLKTLFSAEQKDERTGSASSSQTSPSTSEAATPVRLHPDLSIALLEEWSQQNTERHDWFEHDGAPDRETVRGNYQRQADFQVSTTDPDATIMPMKNGAHRSYQTHYLVDGGKSRIILAALVTPSEVMENQPALDLMWRACFRWKLRPRQFTGDTIYGSAENIMALEQQGVRAYVPLPDFDQRNGFFGQRAFRYDAQRDVYMCAAEKELHVLPSGCTDQFIQYRGKASVCNACSLRSQCTSSSVGRRLSRHVAEEHLERVRAYHRTEAYKKAMRKRSVWVEPLFAEGKQWHGMRRFRLRRLWRVNSEALIRAAGQNLKRLLKKRGWGRRPGPTGEAMVLFSVFLLFFRQVTFFLFSACSPLSANNKMLDALQRPARLSLPAY